MKTVRDVSALRALVGAARSADQSIGFVPTMGALHPGHLSLVRQARREQGFVVVSIFVNPLQFAPGEDFERYPRREEEDSRLLEAERVDVLYRPEPTTFYGDDFSTRVQVGGVSEGGEGSIRPDHFLGVATVVAKLFHQVAPDAAYFGRKDLQQVAVISRMVRDLDFPVALRIGETVREANGLAMSSRNAYLSAQERERAAALPRALFAARDLVGRGERDPAQIEKAVRAELERAGLTVDYVEVVDSSSMRPPTCVGPGTSVTAAIRVGKTRLIDNVMVPEVRE